MRTTIDIDDPVLQELKAVGAGEGKSLGRLVFYLLAAALASRSQGRTTGTKPLRWLSKPMAARVDLADREALYDAMENRRQ